MLAASRFLSTTNLLIMPQGVRAIFEYVFVPHNEKRQGASAFGVRRGKAALSSGCKSHPASAPAGSNRSSKSVHTKGQWQTQAVGHLDPA